MSPVNSGAANVGLFLAHALTLENEAAERYVDLADSMETHNNREVAELFHKLSGYSRLHADEVKEKAAQHGGPIPHVAPWDFGWPNKESPESAAFEDAHYLMTPHHALRMALKGEEAGRNYYASVAAETKDAEVAKLAREFAEEESGHVKLIQEWLEKFPAPRTDWDADTDPPVISD